jgi:hypothetical protein
MPNIEIIQHKNRIDRIFSRVASLPPNDFELRSDWARYLCVLVSGFIEKSVHSLLIDIATKQSSPTVARFVRNKITDLQNPKMEKILELIRQFNNDWESRIRIATEGEYKAAVDSIVGNKNRIAHGENVTISYDTVRRYYQGVVKVIEIIEAECL